MSYKHIPAKARKEIAAEAGRAAHRAGTCHQYKAGEEARTNGRLGGLKTSADSAWMKEIGRRGVLAREAKRKMRESRMIQNSQIREKIFKGKTLKFVCVERMEWDPSWWSFTDEDHVREEHWNIKPGDVVFDIGAAYGSYTLTALALGAAHVFAWSPQGHPKCPPGEMEADFIVASLAANGWSDRCTIMRDGLYSKSGWVNAATQEFFANEPPMNNDIVRVRTPAEWLSGWGKAQGLQADEWIASPCWVKIDTEGAEPEILKGLLDPIIAPFSPKLLIENHNFKRASLEQEVRELVTSWGYREVATRPYGAITHSFYVPE